MQCHSGQTLHFRIGDFTGLQDSVNGKQVMVDYRFVALTTSRPNRHFGENGNSLNQQYGEFANPLSTAREWDGGSQLYDYRYRKIWGSSAFSQT